MNSDGSIFRKRIYALLITLAAGTTAGRILAVELVYEPPWTPERMTEDARWELGML